MIVQDSIQNKSSTNLMSVDDDTFVELIEIKNDYLKFVFSCRIDLNNSKKNIQEYEFIKVVATSDVPYSTSNSNSLSKNTISLTTNLKTNTVVETTTIKKSSNVLGPKYPQTVLKKLLMGQNLVQTLNKKENTLCDPYEISISSSKVQSLMNGVVTSYDLVLRENLVKKEGKTFSDIDPKNLITRINNNFQDLTSVTDEKNINEFFNFDDTDLLNRTNKLYVDLLKYYLVDLKGSEFEDNIPVYEKTKKTERLSYCELKTDFGMLIPIEYKNSRITVRFELYKKSETIPDEVVSKTFSSSEHIDAYYSLKYPPEITIKTTDIKSNQVINVGIHDKELNGNIPGYNVYLKNLDSSGNFTEFQKIEEIINQGSNTISISPNSKLSVLRIVPKQSDGKESNIFTDKLIGPGYSKIGSLTIASSFFQGDSSIHIDIIDAPRDATTFSLYSRNCTTGNSGKFSLAGTLNVSVDSKNYSFFIPVDSGKIFEYYVVALSRTGTESSKVDNISVSNYILLKHPHLLEKVNQSSSIVVSLENFQTSVSLDGKISNYFDIKTAISAGENQKITDAFKEQLNELYEQFLNPSNNSTSALGTGNYADVIIHEVIRTNLNTSERENFGTIINNKFIDDFDSQKIYGIKPINPYHNYLYQVFTYRRDPMTLLKNYVARAQNGNWFYSPYKWRNPKVLNTGKLYAEDSNGVPIIETYDSLSSESYGLTASYKYQNSLILNLIKDVSVHRLDRNTVKIGWSYQGSSEYENNSIHDTFVVLKIVNGVRSFVGRTKDNFIYHELTNDDAGSIYYLIVPVLKNMSLGVPVYSNYITVDTISLIPPIPVSLFSSYKINNTY